MPEPTHTFLHALLPSHLIRPGLVGRMMSTFVHYWWSCLSQRRTQAACFSTRVTVVCLARAKHRRLLQQEGHSNYSYTRRILSLQTIPITLVVPRSDVFWIRPRDSPLLGLTFCNAMQLLNQRATASAASARTVLAPRVQSRRSGCGIWRRSALTAWK